MEVMYQSEVVLKDPSDYWISVINVGRSLKINQVQKGYLSHAWLPPPKPAAEVAPDVPDAAVPAAATSSAPLAVPASTVSEPAGCVVSALMHCGDVLGLAPTSVACGGSETGDRCAHDLALEYLVQSKASLRNKGLVVLPTLIDVPDISTFLANRGGGGVTGEGPSDGGATAVAAAGFAAVASDDDYFVGDDPKAGANKKMKRAFCEPGNVKQNPPLAIAKSVLLDLFGKVEVADGGGAGCTVFSGAGAAATMDAAFQADTLTPQLLKPCVTAAMASVLDAVNAKVKASPSAKKADAALKQWVKSAAKGGGGKKK